MADVSISGLTALGAAPATADLLCLVDVSDTTQAPTGTTKKMTVANLFTSPSIASPTITSGVVVSSGVLEVTPGNGQRGIKVSGGAFLSLYDATPVEVVRLQAASNAMLFALEQSGGAVKFQNSSSQDILTLADTKAATFTGTLVVQGATATMPLLVGIGGLTAAFPALKRSGATLEVRAADDSGYTNLNVSALSTATGDVFSQTNVTASTGVFKVGANQVVGARNTGWAAQTVTTGAKTDIGASGTWTTTSVGNLLMAHHAMLLAHGLLGA